MAEGATSCDACRPAVAAQWICPVCDSVVPANSPACPACATPLTSPPPARRPAPPRKKRSWGCLAGALGTLLVACVACLTVSAVVLALDVPTRLEMLASGRLTEVGGPKEPWDEAAQRAAVGKVAAAFEAALLRGDAGEAARMVDPGRRAGYEQVFASHRDELPDLGRVLATRKLTTLTTVYAEYEVAENGRKSTIRFLRLDGQWYLESL